MLTTLKIELIGNPKQGFSPAWVKRIIDFNNSGLETQELKAHTDYTNANSVGSRGSFKYYFLAEEALYHVSSPLSWKRTDEYYCKVSNGEIIRLTFEEMLQCLEKQVLARAYMQRR